MLLALPVVIIDWLITFVLKKTPVYFSISWSQAGLFMDLNHPCLETFFCPFLCFCEHPFLQLVVPHSCVPDLSLSLPSHPPASPAGESLCADWWNFFFPSRNTGSIKMTLAVLARWSSLPLLPCRRSRSGSWLPVGKVLWREQWESKLFLLLDGVILDLKVLPSQQTTWIKTAAMSKSHVGRCGFSLHIAYV